MMSIYNLIYGIFLVIGGIVCFILYIKKAYPRGDDHGLNFRLIVGGIIGIILGVIFIKDWVISLLK